MQRYDPVHNAEDLGYILHQAQRDLERVRQRLDALPIERELRGAGSAGQGTAPGVDMDGIQSVFTSLKDVITRAEVELRVKADVILKSVEDARLPPAMAYPPLHHLDSAPTSDLVGIQQRGAEAGPYLPYASQQIQHPRDSPHPHASAGPLSGATTASSALSAFERLSDAERRFLNRPVANQMAEQAHIRSLQDPQQPASNYLIRKQYGLLPDDGSQPRELNPIPTTSSQDSKNSSKSRTAGATTKQGVRKRGFTRTESHAPTPESTLSSAGVGTLKPRGNALKSKSSHIADGKVTISAAVVAEQGLAPLIEKGAIPSFTDVTSAFSGIHGEPPLRGRVMPLRPADMKRDMLARRNIPITAMEDPLSQLANVKFDVSAQVSSVQGPPDPKQAGRSQVSDQKTTYFGLGPEDLIALAANATRPELLMEGGTNGRPGSAAGQDRPQDEIRSSITSEVDARVSGRPLHNEPQPRSITAPLTTQERRMVPQSLFVPPIPDMNAGKAGAMADAAWLAKAASQPAVIKGLYSELDHAYGTVPELALPNKQGELLSRGTSDKTEKTSSALVPVDQSANGEPEKDSEPVTSYDDLLNKFALHQISVRNGRIVRDTPEFLAFKRKATVIWRPVEAVLSMLELFSHQHGIQTAHISGVKVFNLAQDEGSGGLGIFASVSAAASANSFEYRPGASLYITRLPPLTSLSKAATVKPTYYNPHGFTSSPGGDGITVKTVDLCYGQLAQRLLDCFDTADTDLAALARRIRAGILPDQPRIQYALGGSNPSFPDDGLNPPSVTGVALPSNTLVVGTKASQKVSTNSRSPSKTVTFGTKTSSASSALVEYKGEGTLVPSEGGQLVEINPSEGEDPSAIVGQLRKAGVKIMSSLRMYRARRLYLMIRTRLRATVRIQRAWRRHAALKATRILLAKVWERDFLQWREASLKFIAAWPQISNKRRVVIHVPSLSLPTREREMLTQQQLHIRENAQLARLVDVMDPNVDVIYISPFTITEEIRGYWLKLLELGLASRAASLSLGGEASNPYAKMTPEEISASITSRVRIIGVDSHESSSLTVARAKYHFPPTLSLTRRILLSHKLLKRIRTLVAGRPAYIVPFHVSLDEIRLAVRLGFPLLGYFDTSTACIPPLLSSSRLQAMPSGSDPAGNSGQNASGGSNVSSHTLTTKLHDEGNCETQFIRQTKSSTRSFFHSIGFALPSGTSTPVNSLAGIATALGRLILQHLSINRWVIKLEYESDARGFLMIDADRIRTVQMLRKDKASRRQRWSLPEARHRARETLSHDIRRNIMFIARLCNPAAWGPVSPPNESGIEVAGTTSPLEALDRYDDPHHSDRIRLFFARLAITGGIVEAVPESIINSPTVDIFIDFQSRVEIRASYDQVFSSPFIPSGATFPSNVPSRRLHASARRIGKALAERGVVGHVSIDFVQIAAPLTQEALDYIAAQQDADASHPASALHQGRRMNLPEVLGVAGVDLPTGNDTGLCEEAMPDVTVSNHICTQLLPVDLNLYSSKYYPSFSMFHFLCRGRYSVSSRHGALLSAIVATADSPDCDTTSQLSFDRASYVIPEPQQMLETDGRGDVLTKSESTDSFDKSLLYVGESPRTSEHGDVDEDPLEHPLSITHHLRKLRERADLLQRAEAQRLQTSQQTGPKIPRELATLAKGTRTLNRLRYFATAPQIYLSALALLQLPAFFAASRHSGLTFDLPTAHGVVFLLFDSLASGTVGLICMADNPDAALALLNSALSFATQQANVLRLKARATTPTTLSLASTEINPGSSEAADEAVTAGLLRSCEGLVTAQSGHSALVSKVVQESRL